VTTTTVRAGRHRRPPARTYPEGTWMRLRDPELLRAAIRDRDLTQREVAILAGVSPSFVSHLLPPADRPDQRPRRRSCTPDVAARIAATLRRPVEHLFYPVGRDEPSTGDIPLPRVPAR